MANKKENITPRLQPPSNRTQQDNAAMRNSTATSASSQAAANVTSVISKSSYSDNSRHHNAAIMTSATDLPNNLFRGPVVDLGFSISKFQNDDNGNVDMIWLCVTSSPHVAVTTLFKLCPAASVKYNDRMKMWLVTTEIYETLVNILLSDKFRQCVRVTELPKFLVKGLTTYVQKQRMIKEASQSDMELQL
eukprot:GSChrysophyteH2.ASY1.ANO1.943.1 assembled CDS